MFLAIVAIFHAWLGEERDAMESALVEGTLLALAVLTLFAALAGLPRRRSRRPGTGMIQTDRLSRDPST